MILRIAQKYTVINNNFTRYYLNIYLKSMRKFGIEYKINTQYITSDNKNKIKLDAPREPLVIAKLKIKDIFDTEIEGGSNSNAIELDLVLETNKDKTVQVLLY